MATKAITKKEKIAAVLLVLSGVSLLLLYLASLVGVISPTGVSPLVAEESVVRVNMTLFFYFLSVIVYAFFV